MVSRCQRVLMPSSLPTLSTATRDTSPSPRSSGPSALCRRTQWDGLRTHTSPSPLDSATASVRAGRLLSWFWSVSVHSPLTNQNYCTAIAPQVSGLRRWKRRWCWPTFCVTSASKPVRRVKSCGPSESSSSDRRRASGSNWKRGNPRLPQTSRQEGIRREHPPSWPLSTHFCWWRTLWCFLNPPREVRESSDLVFSFETVLIIVDIIITRIKSCKNKLGSFFVGFGDIASWRTIPALCVSTTLHYFRASRMFQNKMIV